MHLNVYQNFLLCAMKLHGYVCEWGPPNAKRSKLIEGRSMDFRGELAKTVHALDAIHDIMNQCYASLRSMARSRSATANDMQWNLNKSDVYL